MTSSAQKALPRFLPLERAARIVAPISTDIEGHYFRGGVLHLLHMLGEFDIAVEAHSEPPRPPFEAPAPPLTREWFAAVQPRQASPWKRTFLKWCQTSLKVSRQGIIANLSPPSGKQHPPAGDVDAAGASWSFPQALAWIATREPLEVARMQYGQHFGPPMDDADPASRAMLQSDEGRRLLTGWLAIRTSLDRCKCGSEPTINREPWETCQCLGRAYDELREFAKASPHPIPEFQPSPSRGTFTLTWPTDAHLLRFARAEIVERLHPLQATEVPPTQVGKNRKLDHDGIRRRAQELRRDHPRISLGSAAASIIAELGVNPRTGRPWDCSPSAPMAQI